MDIISKQYSFVCILAYIIQCHVIALIRRHQTILITIHNGTLQTLPVGNSRLAVSQFISREFFQTYIKTKLTHRSYIRTEFYRSRFIPTGHMGIHSFRREELGKAPLDINTFYRIRIVAAPELCEIFKRFVVATGTTTGTTG